MNRQQAIEILTLYRPGTAKDDPEFAEALAFLKHDPDLARWFESHRAVQDALRTRFQQIEVPEGLKEQILSERKAQTTLGPRRKALLLGAAVAGIFLILGILILNRPPAEDKSFSGFRTRMVGIVLRSYPKMDLETNDLGQIQKYLAQQGRGDYVLPAALNKTAGTGCKLLTWQGQPVSMVCFNSGQNARPKAPDLFLFIMDQSAVSDAPAANAPQLAQISKLATVSWSQAGKLYLLGAAGSAKPLQDAVAADVSKL